MKPINQTSLTLAADAIDAILPSTVRQALRRILQRVWIDDWDPVLPGDEPEDLGHAYYLVARWLHQLEQTTRSIQGSNVEACDTKTLLTLKNVFVTAGAADDLCWEEIMDALHRHSCGDWGVVCKEDRAENDRAVKNGGRILSVYPTTGEAKFWIITDAGHETTTVLLPSEY